MYANAVPKNFGSKQIKIQQKRLLFLFPELQETKYAPVVVELMKIQINNLRFNSTNEKWKQNDKKDKKTQQTTAFVTIS